MITYETGTGIKFVEEDNFAEGCNPDTSHHVQIDIKFADDTINGIIDKIKNYFNIENEDIEFNSCEENGRIDFSILENICGHKATKQEIEHFKNKEYTLYLAIYTYYIEQVERKAVQIPKEVYFAL